MTAAHAVDCHYFEWADFAPLDRWIDVFEKHLERGGAAQHRRTTGCASTRRS